MGNLARALVQRKMTYASSGFIQDYVSPWFSLFQALTDLFPMGLFAYIATIFLYTETKDKNLKSILRKRGIIIITGFLDKDGITFYFLESPTSLISLLSATFLIMPYYFLLKTKEKFLMRAIARSKY